MDNYIKELLLKFNNIKKMGWIKGIQQGFGSAGRTFESCLGNSENSFEIPDYHGIEIKTKYSKSEAYITLFNATPNGPHYHEIERLKNEYGYPDRKLKDYKVLNNSIYANFRTLIGRKFYFNLKVNSNDEKIYLCIYDSNNNLMENNVYWDFDTIKEKLYRKMKLLALIDVDHKKENNDDYFKYNEIAIYSLTNFETFLELLNLGIIRITFKIGIYRFGNKFGKIYDHGTGFEIKKENLLKLYNRILQ